MQVEEREGKERGKVFELREGRGEGLAVWAMYNHTYMPSHISYSPSSLSGQKARQGGARRLACSYEARK